MGKGRQIAALILVSNQISGLGLASYDHCSVLCARLIDHVLYLTKTWQQISCDCSLYPLLAAVTPQGKCNVHGGCCGRSTGGGAMRGSCGCLCPQTSSLMQHGTWRMWVLRTSPSPPRQALGNQHLQPAQTIQQLQLIILSRTIGGCACCTALTPKPEMLAVRCPCMTRSKAGQFMHLVHPIQLEQAGNAMLHDL